MSNLNQDRAGVINRISQGLKKNIISGADILALAAESASKKRLEKCQCNQVSDIRLIYFLTLMLMILWI